MGDGIDNGSGLDKRPSVGTDNGPGLAKGPSAGTGNGTELDEGPVDRAGLRDGTSDSMSA